MFKKRYVAAAACALAMVGAANAVEVSRTGTGDFLIAPAYFIGGGMSTDLKVINTSATDSVVAKVVFRHPVTSAETLDFLIYLSPSDVWTGSVSCEASDANGNCTRSVVFSSDDSMQLPGSTDMATPANPARIVSETNGDVSGRVALPNQGYVEVLMSSAYSVAPNRPGVTKANVILAHQAGPSDIAIASTPNVLTGTVTANAPGIGGATLPMLALADYDNSFKAQIGGLSGLDDLLQRTSVADVEEALWTNNLAVPYSTGAGKVSLVTFTFPTKLSFLNGPAYLADPRTGPYNRFVGQFPFARQTCISANIYDHSENTIAGNIFNVSPLPPSQQTCVDEFQWLAFGSNSNIRTPFAEGWARLTFNNARAAAGQQRTATQNSNVGRMGAPAIATYLIREPNKFTWAYASSTR